MTLVLNGTTGVSAVDGSASTPAIQGNDSNTGIFFPAADTIAFAEGGAEVARFDSSGNFGIGTNSPAYKLDVSDASAQMRLLATTGTNFAFYRAQNTGGTGFFGLENSAGSALSTGAPYSLNIYHGGAYPILFSTNATERMRIDSSGNLLVGTTSPQSRLTVQGTVANSNTGNLSVWSTSGGDVGSCAAAFVKFDNNTTTSQVFVRFAINQYNSGCGQINANGAGSAAFGAFSDARLKENIVDLPPQLANIMALRPVEFDYIESEGGGHQTGFIAQEMQQIYPDTVGERAPDGMLTITGWSKTEARLVKAIQEQQAMIQQLQAEVAALKGAQA